MAHAFSKILTDEGIPALYKGFLPICVRVLADTHHLDVCVCVHDVRVPRCYAISVEGAEK